MTIRSFAILLSIALLWCWPPAAVASPFAYITNSEDDTVSVIDTATNTVTSTIPTGHGPVGLAVSPDGRRVYVTTGTSSVAPGEVSIIDAATNREVERVTLGHLPTGIAINPTGTRVYVANTGDQSLSVIDTSTNAVLATVPVGANPLGVAINRDGTLIYVTVRNSAERRPCLSSAASLFCDEQISIVDATTNTELNPLNRLTITDALAGTLSGITVAESGSIYVDGVRVAGSLLSAVWVLAPQLEAEVDLGITARIGVDYKGVTLNPAGTRVYASNRSGGVSVIDTVPSRLIATVPIGDGLAGLSLTPDGAHLYVANNMNDTVAVVDTSTNSVTDTIPVGRFPVAFGQFIGPQDVPFSPPPTDTPTATPTVTPTPTRPSCAGDCDGSDSVGIEELVQCVRIALGSVPLAQCAACDANSDGRVTVDELVAEVGVAINGCPGQ